MSDIEQLRTGTTAILFVALIAGVGVIVLGEFQVNEEYDVHKTNQTVNFTSTDWVTVECNNTNPYWVSIYNNSVVFTNGTHNYSFAVQGGNFSVDTTVGRVAIVNTGQINMSRLQSNGAALWNVSCTYKAGSAARNTFGEGVLGVQEITGWLDIIALALVLGVVVAFVMKAIYDRNVPRQGY